MINKNCDYKFLNEIKEYLCDFLVEVILDYYDFSLYLENIENKIIVYKDELEIAKYNSFDELCDNLVINNKKFVDSLNDIISYSF